jgi:hypothetical protein
MAYSRPLRRAVNQLAPIGLQTPGVPGDQGGHALRDHSLSNRLYPRDHSHPAAHLGETTTVIIEAPIMLAASWLSAAGAWIGSM